MSKAPAASEAFTHVKPTATHDVFNQVPTLSNYNLFESDICLSQSVAREGGGFAHERLHSFGRLTGSHELIQAAILSNKHSPVLLTHDRTGNRIDEVEFHPAWHQLMSLSVENQVHSLPWNEPREGVHVARAALFFMDYQNEQGHCCPITMTYSVVPALRKQPDLAKKWERLITSTVYDSRFIPAGEKSGLIFGMAMTEKQGGSDVRANTTRAVPAEGQGGPGREYVLTGHKWFCSAPMADGFLVLAQAPGGLSCFLVPRFLPDGTRNNFFIQRLKDKVGNRSNASSEVEFNQTIGWLVGEEGRGVPTIIEMVNHTRLDCTIGSAALMRQALVQAMHHASYRSAFGRLLNEQPLMLNVLADLALESEAATLLAMRIARSYDRQTTDESERLFKRIASAIGKYYVCKKAPAVVSEAMECLGGAGYVEESMMPRLYREAPLNSIWEGSGNVLCLDVLRAIDKEPGSIEALVAEFDTASGLDKRLDKFVADIKNDLRAITGTTNANKQESREFSPEATARHLVERLALALQGCLTVKHSPTVVAEAFLDSRIAASKGTCFGTLSSKADLRSIVERAAVHR